MMHCLLRVLHLRLRDVIVFLVHPHVVCNAEREIKDKASELEELLDMCMLRLRLSDGLDLDMLNLKFGSKATKSIAKALSPHLQEGLVCSNQRIISLKDPEGFLMSNDIISDIFAELDSIT